MPSGPLAYRFRFLVLLVVSAGHSRSCPGAAYRSAKSKPLGARVDGSLRRLNLLSRFEAGRDGR